MLHEAVVMNDTTEVTRAIQFQVAVQAVLSMLPCLFFLYVNCVMLFALLRKPLLLECSRYVLFGHLLLTESLQIVISVVLYIFAVTPARNISYICVIFILFASLTLKMSPLNLAVMSLERYIAVCFPLRHAEITTTRRIKLSIVVIWTLASVESFTQLFLFVSLENTSFTVRGICHRQIVFRLEIYATINKAFTSVFFISVGMIIIYTYIAITITAKSVSDVGNASKAHKTVLLHLFQLCLCLTSTLFGMIDSSNTWTFNPTTITQIRYTLFMVLIVFPKCLSPLIYGLRDHTFRHVFKYYFTFGFKTTVKTSPKC